MSVGHSVTAVFNGVLHPFFIHSGGCAADAAARSGYTSYRPQGAQDIYRLQVTRLRHDVATAVTFTGYKLRWTSYLH